MQFLSAPVVAMRVAVAVTRSRIPLLVAMFVCVISIMAAIAAIAARNSYGGHHYHNPGGGFVNHHFGYLTVNSVGLPGTAML